LLAITVLKRTHHSIIVNLFCVRIIVSVLLKVIKSMSGPPNYWDLDRIETNFFKRYKRSDLSIMHYS